MATNTSRLGLLKKDTATDGNDTFNIKTMLNDNWDKIDAKVATLGADGKVPAEQLSISVSDASTTQKGVVQLEDSVTSASVTKAATPKSVKAVSDALDAHKTDLTAHGIGMTDVNIKKSLPKLHFESPNATKSADIFYNANDSVDYGLVFRKDGNDFLQVTDDKNVKFKDSSGAWDTLANLKTYANDGKTAVANSVNSMGVAASPADTFSQLATKIGQINTSNFKSLQRGSTSYYANSIKVIDIPISAVDITKSIVLIDYIVTGSSSNDDQVGNHLIAAYFTSPTNLRIIKENALSNATVYWTVIEFKAIKGVQSGSQAITARDTYINIAPVDLSRSIVIAYTTSNSVQQTGTAKVITEACHFDNNSRLMFNQYDTTAKTLYWQVLEF